MGNPRLSHKRITRKTNDGVSERKQRSRLSKTMKSESSPATQSQSERFIESLRTAAEYVAEPATRKRLGLLVRLLQRERVSITFGGHFNSGKSSVINAALGRTFLPMDDLPETGVICVLRAGDNDHAEAHNDGHKWTIECTTEAIRREVALTSEFGERRTQVMQVERLDLTLDKVVIPPLSNWIDSPGINDEPEMNARALLATKYADVLVWVLTSKQGLSEVEMEFLASHIGRRGPSSVVFLLNVFLAEHELSWKAFLNEKLPRFLNKLRHHASALGFTDEATAEVIPIDALKLLKSKTNGYGRAELNRLLLSIDSRQNPRVVRTRLHHVRRELHAMVERLRAMIDAEEGRVAKECLALVQRAKEQSEGKRPGFLIGINKAVSDFISTSARKASSCGASMIRGIRSGSLRRDNSYGNDLSLALKKVVGPCTEELLRVVNTLALKYDQTPLTQKLEDELRQMLDLPDVTVTVPNTPIEKGSSGWGALIGGTIGFFIGGGPVGAAIGAGIGAAGGRADANATLKALEADVAGAKSSITGEADKAATALRGKRTQLKSFILRHCVATSVAASETTPKASYLTDLREDLKIVSNLVDKVAALVGPLDAEQHILDIGEKSVSPPQAPTSADNVLELQ
jgi:hypothetical protein